MLGVLDTWVVTCSIKLCNKIENEMTKVAFQVTIHKPNKPRYKYIPIIVIDPRTFHSPYMMALWYEGGKQTNIKMIFHNNPPESW